MKIDVKAEVVETKNVVLTLTQEEAKSLFALATYHPLTGEDYTDALDDFRRDIRVGLVTKLGRFNDIERSTYVARY
jgi:hypothetical protein